jgi:hypothetical protein
MDDFTFPFDTCEKPQQTFELGGLIVAQPWSVAVNMISISIIVYYLLKTKKVYTFVLIFMLFLFELFHTFSHATHLNGKTQNIIVHVLAILVNICYLYAFYKSTKLLPSKQFIVFITAIGILDIYFLNYFTFLYTVFTQILIFSCIFLYYKSKLSLEYQTRIPYIIVIMILIIIVLANERYNCKKMLEIYPNFPFHIIIESLGIVGFSLVLPILCKL